jgi:signal transduction histidine kinase
MLTSQQPYVLIAMADEDRGAKLNSVVNEMGLRGEVLSEAEAVLYHTRGSVPEALIIEHALARTVRQLDLIAVLRRRKPLESVPLVYLGPPWASAQTTALDSGADVYLPLPTQPQLVQGYLKRLLKRRQLEKVTAEALERMRSFERAYQDSERVKDDLIHMLVHDLKSPISSVMGLLEHSLEMIGVTDTANEVEELLSLARSEAQHLLNLAANILDVRRMKIGQMPYSPRKVDDLTKLARYALRDVSGAPRERQIDFQIQPEAEQLNADSDLLRRILANLFSNAIKHTRRGGNIQFRAVQQDGAYLLSVADDGEGIPQQDQKRIFNAFEQSRHTVHDRFDTGMGLTFCKLAVEKHGGEIWVESEVGRGSTFAFTIPVDVKNTLNEEKITISEI